MKDFKQLFLKEYFTLTAIAKDAMSPSQRKNAFCTLAKAFLLSDKQTTQLWNLAEAESVSKISTESDYRRYCRINQYLEDIMNADFGDDKEEKIIAIKGGAINEAVKSELLSAEDEIAENVFRNIVYKAGEGNITAMRMLAVMQLLGVFVERDVQSGLKNLAKVAKWNDIPAALLHMYYCREDRQEYCDRLLTVLKMRYLSSLTKIIDRDYAVCAKNFNSDKIATLVEKAFNASVLTRDEYSSAVARIIFSEILSYADKETIVFAIDAKQPRTSICDLPLKLKADMPYELNESAFDGMIFKRAQEQERIWREAQNFDLRRLANYSPMCLCADSGVLLRAYVQSIKNLAPQAHVEVIEVKELTAANIDGNVNNVFVKSCSEDKFNIYVLSIRGAVEQAALDSTLNFLKSAKRRCFKLNHPSAQIDLSSILPICVCDKANVETLRKFCNVIELASVSDEEKKAIVDSTLARKAELYGIDGIAIDDDIRKAVERLSADNIEKALDKAILANRFRRGKLILSEQMLGKIIGEFKPINKFGFGGSIHEDK